MGSQVIKDFSLQGTVSVALLVVSLAGGSIANAETQPTISTDGVIESKDGGFKFPDDTVQTTAAHTTRYEVGDTGPGGGIVFYVTAMGFHGLEAAPAEQDTTAQWGCYDTDVNGVENLFSSTTEDPNSGSRNTPLIAAECGAASAAGAAAAYEINGVDDWFLPNKEELDLLYENKAVVGGFASVYYWSSSEYYFSSAWFQQFGIGYQDFVSKTETFGVRAVRVF